jgi:hypothetical protein
MASVNTRRGLAPVDERELAAALEHPRATERKRLLAYREALRSPEAYAALPEADRDAIVRWAEIRRRLSQRGLDQDPANLADPLLPSERLRALVLAGERVLVAQAFPAGTDAVDDAGGDLIQAVARIRAAG